MTCRRDLLLAASLALSCCVACFAQRSDDPEVIFSQASQAMQTGDFTKAEIGLKALLAADPKDVAALGNLGVLYARTHRYAEAIRTDQAALRLDPESRPLLLNLALAYLKQEQYAQAEPPLARLHAAAPDDRRTAILLATAQVLGQKPAAGLGLLRSLPAQPPSEPSSSSIVVLEATALARTGHVDEARDVFRQLMMSPDTRAPAQLLLAQAFYDGERFGDAEAAVRDALTHAPALPDAHRLLGKILLSEQDSEGAERELRTALAQAPDDANTAYFLGALLVQKGANSEGEALLKRAGTQLSDSWAVPFYLGKAELAEHHTEAAVTLLQQAASMNADEPQVFYLLARALRAVDRSQEAKVAMARVEALHTSALEAEKRAASLRVAGAH